MVVAWVMGRVIPGLAVLPRYRAADELCREVLVVWFSGSRSCRCIRCRLLWFFEHQGMVLREFQPDYFSRPPTRHSSPCRCPSRSSRWRTAGTPVGVRCSTSCGPRVPWGSVLPRPDSGSFPRPFPVGRIPMATEWHVRVSLNATTWFSGSNCTSSPSSSCFSFSILLLGMSMMKVMVSSLVSSGIIVSPSDPAGSGVIS